MYRDFFKCYIRDYYCGFFREPESPKKGFIISVQIVSICILILIIWSIFISYLTWHFARLSEQEKAIDVLNTESETYEMLFAIFGSIIDLVLIIIIVLYSINIYQLLRTARKKQLRIMDMDLLYVQDQLHVQALRIQNDANANLDIRATHPEEPAKPSTVHGYIQ
jgi:heme/copper-type cytochrome/quinol oxidase subunit 2